MTSLSSLNSAMNNALQGTASGKRDLTPAGKNNVASTPLTAPQETNKLAQRVSQLGRATVDMAQQFLGDFAQSLFGEAAKGMKVSFDSFELSAQSTAAAAAYQASGPEGSTSAAAFRLEDASSFTGRGTLTTADGRSFEFEIEVRYQRVQEAAYASSSQQLPAAQSQAAPGAAPANTPLTAGDLRSQFAGIASDLLDALSAEPVRQPFSLQLPQEENGKPPLTLLGDLALQLLNLKGGPRHVDLAKVGQDSAKPRLAAQA
ncbi:hypothetical protein [Chitinilyticum litopenaei]|uniref:hypothetical protein n=1 Tax=Chitinilyticum litopenaei TaxID=1121276 RepID=UPI0004105EDB|nr:hypothetical protein [Chitinilyticum litopenaei]